MEYEDDGNLLGWSEGWRMRMKDKLSGWMVEGMREMQGGRWKASEEF